MSLRILVGHVLDRLRELPDESVHMVVTSPPYWGLRDYGIEPQVWGGDPVGCAHEWGGERDLRRSGGTGASTLMQDGRRDDVRAPNQERKVVASSVAASTGAFCALCGAWRGSLGLEPDYRLYIEHLVEVFREVRRVLRKDGTCWLNLGDCYATGAGKVGDHPGGGAQGARWAGRDDSKGRGTRTKADGQSEYARYVGPPSQPNRMPQPGLKPKDLAMIPARVAIALQDDGWWVRSDIIWCLSGGAWVYARTQKGDMPIMIKDLVRLDPRTVSLWNGEKWTPVLGWGPSNDTTERLELVLRSGERIGCTGGHLWPTQRGNVAARDLAVGDKIASCTLPEPGGQRPPYLTDDALWLAGLYLAEGCRSNNALALTLSVDELPWVDRIAAVAGHFGGSCTHTVYGNTLVVRLYGRVLHAVIEVYIGGKAAIDKHLKVAAWRLPNDALRHLVQGYLDGDGHHDKGNGRWRLGFCRNYGLERDLRTAAARLNATITLNPGVATYQSGEAPIFRGEWRWQRSGHWSEKDRGEIVEIRNSRARQFWDIAVEDEPHLFALASGVLTHNCKKSPMPESVTDRPTSAHEHVFMLTKSERYFFDAEAVKEDAVADHGSGYGYAREGRLSFANKDGTPRGNERPWTPPKGAKGNAKTFRGGVCTEDRAFDNGTPMKRDSHGNAPNPTMKRNMRNVWHLGPEPFPEAHFATFPSEVPRRAILAGSSERGCCAKCAAPYQRVVEKTRTFQSGSGRAGNLPAGKNGPALQGGGETLDIRRGPVVSAETIDWQPTCRCGVAEVRPAVVLDPFFGAGTTGLVADQLGRDCIGIELNPSYASMARRRIERDAGLFADIASDWGGTQDVDGRGADGP